VRRKRPEKWTRNSWFLLHDNAPANRSLVVKMYLVKHNVTALEHLKYSPHRSQPDSFLFFFLRLKSVLKEQQLVSVAAKVMKTLTEVSNNGVLERLDKLYERWQNCVTARQNYFKGNVV
jgi:hypothetical protein